MASKTIQAWEINEKDYPGQGSYAERLKFVLNYAVLAPSPWNSQPWKFRVGVDHIDIFVDPDRDQEARDPEGREVYAACGAALFNLRLAMRHFGLGERTAILPSADDKKHIARVKIVPGSDHHPAEDKVLMQAILQRHCCRHEFEETPIEESILQELSQACAQEGAEFVPTSRQSTQMALAGLVAEGDRDLGSSEDVRKEYASWVRASDRQGDGVPGYALGLNAVESMLAPVTRRMFNFTDENARLDRELTLAAPCAVTICTKEDTFKDWINAGQALQHMLLVATHHNIKASFINQPIPVASLRSRLRTLIGTENQPQLVLRLGYKDIPSKCVPRRPLAEVIIK